MTQLIRDLTVTAKILNSANRFTMAHEVETAIEELKCKDDEISRLKKMIDNGLGWEDLESDIKPF